MGGVTTVDAIGGGDNALVVVTQRGGQQGTAHGTGLSVGAISSSTGGVSLQAAVALTALGADSLLAAGGGAAQVLGLGGAAAQIADVIAVVLGIGAGGGLAALTVVLAVGGGGAVGVSHSGEHGIVGSRIVGGGQVDDRTALGGSPTDKVVVIVVVQSLLRSHRAGGDGAEHLFRGDGLTIHNPSDLDGLALLAGNPVVVLGAIGVVITGLSVGGIQQRAVTVLQLDRSQRNQVIQAVAGLDIVLGRLLVSVILGLIVLEHQSIGAGTIVHAQDTGALGGDDVGATANDGEVLGQNVVPDDGAVDVAVGHHNAVDVEDHVLEIGDGALFALAGGIGSRDKILAGIDKVQAVLVLEGVLVQTGGPVLAVEEDQVVTGGHSGSGSLGNADLQNSLGTHGQAGAGQHSNILLQGGGATPDGDIDVVGDGQDEVGGIHGVAGQSHHDGGQGAIAVGIQIQGVGGGIVLFDDVAILAGLEHSVITDELDGGSGDALRSQEEAGGDVGGGTIVVGGGNLYVLYVVLGHGEHQQITGQSQGGVTAAQVGNLEHLVDAGTVVGGDGTVTVDVTPGIQIAVDLDVRAGGHVDIAQSVSGSRRTTCRSGGVTTAYFQSAVDGDGGVCRHGQGAIGIGLYPGNLFTIFTGASGHRTVGLVSIVVGDQQGNTGGNHVIAGDGAVVEQNHSLVDGFCSGGSGFAQIVVLGRTNAEQSDVGGQEYGVNSSILRSNQLKTGILGQILAGGSIVPAVEVVAVRSSSDQLQSGLQSDLFHHLGGDSHAVQGVGTTLGSGLKGQDGVLRSRRNQCQVGDAQTRRSIARRLVFNANAFAGSQSLAELAGNHSRHENADIRTGQIRTILFVIACGIKFILETQYRFRSGIVGQSQDRSVRFSGGTLGSGGNGGTAGGPGGGTGALVGVLPGRDQTGHGSVQSGCREYGGDHRCQHGQSQGDGTDALDPLFHGSGFLSCVVGYH